MALRVAVVGAGPAGFYAAEQLLGKVHDIEVDLFDRLPTPWGLVRAGVAPDHPNIKAVSRRYEKTAQSEGFRFHGNVDIGTRISHDDLARHFHAVMYSTGALGSRDLGIPGEDLPGSVSATDFVAWYNGHPDACDFTFDLSCQRAVVVGNGNVALDVARMLMLPQDSLARTDVADHALEVLRESAIEEVVLLGRRGPAEAAYTTPELRELRDLTDATVCARPAEIELDEASQKAVESDSRVRRNMDIVREYAACPDPGSGRRIQLRFLVSPVELSGDGRVEAVKIVRNVLVEEDGRVKAVPTGEEETIEAGLVIRSIGYKGRAIPGVPFDERSGTIPNDAGRVLDPDSGEPVPGLYVAGWAKRGPTGIIGTNKKDATGTVQSLLEDLEAGKLPEPEGDREALQRLLGDEVVVDYAGWERIDQHERSAGEQQGRPRVKLTRMEALMERALATVETTT